ncbi:hypothetical protein L7F22_010004 [Adiantum nelumboides]|nr:hypothetical protein [Adiantum nelumboides]
MSLPFTTAPLDRPGALRRCLRLTDVVGSTPTVWIDAPFAPSGRGFWAKLEGANPGGIKDRPALHMVEQARERGDLQPGARIVESTSGTLGLGLALAGIAFGHPVTLVSDPGMEPLMYRLLRAYGAEVVTVQAAAACGGWQQARRERVAEILDRYPGAWCPDQYNNPDNVSAYTTLADELRSQLGHIDVLVCSVGTGGHSAGITTALRRYLPDLEVVGVDTVGSTIFGQPARPRLMRGLGFEHPSTQRRSQHLLRSALGRGGRRSVGMPGDGVCQLCQRRLERGRGRCGGRLARPDPAAGREDRRGVPRRAAALLRHRLQRRVLRGEGHHGRRPTRARPGRHRPTRRGRGPPLDPLHHRARTHRAGELMRVLDRYRSFDRPVQLLLLNQLTINLGFYMLIPYLADHLSQGLGLSVLLVGVILGVRNFSQQGMFLVGGSLADRFGYKPMIVAGCALRTGGFALLGLVDNVPALIVASAATGFAGALFNPAVRAYIARDAGERRVEAFALFSVFYQAGIVVGPVVGLLLTGIDFTVTCLVAAAVFAVLTVLQIRALPARRGMPTEGPKPIGGQS